MSPITYSYVTTELSFNVGGREHLCTVRPATTREAISFIEAAGHDDSEDAWPFIREIIFGWLPIRAASLLCSNAVPRVEAVVIVSQFLFTGITRADKSEAKESVRQEGWENLVADVMAAYGQGFEQVMSTPFPAFLGMVRTTRRTHARNAVLRMLHKAVPNIENKGERRAAWNKLLQEAGFPTEVDELRTVTPPWGDGDKEEWKRQKMEEVQRVKTAWAAKRGEA